MARYDFGPQLLNFAGLGNLGQSFTDGYDKAAQKRTLANLGQDIQSGNYAAAAQKAFAAGDAGTAISILGLGQKSTSDANDTRVLQSLGLGGGFGGAASGSSGVSIPRVQAPKQGVHVAENEDDVQRLERATGMVTTDADKAAIVKTVFGEAASESPAGQQAVAAVIRNRANQSGLTPEQVTQRPNQFEPWNTAAGRARMNGMGAERFNQIAGTVAPVLDQGVDPTGGATHFYAPRAQAALGRSAPSWDDGSGADLGNHRFFNHGYGQGGGTPAPSAQTIIAQGGGDKPVQVAQAGDPRADQTPGTGAPAQGFAIPGTGEVVPVETIANNPRLRNLAVAMAAVKDPAKRAGLEKMWQLELEAQKERSAAEGRGLDNQNKRLTNQKLEQELSGDGTRPLTPQERQAYGISPEQPAHMTRQGPKYGPAPTKIINEAQKLQSAEDTKRVEVNTKFLGALADAGPKVSQRMADMDMLASVVRDAPAGPVADTQVFFDRIGAGLGLSKGELATRSDAMKAIIQRLAPAQREEGSGSTSDIEFKGMLASFPSLAATGEGRQMILTTIARQNELTRMRVEVANEWAQGDIPATEARKKIAQIDRASIYASDDEKALVRKLAGTAKGGDLGNNSGALRRSVGGVEYEQRGGQWYPVGGFK